MTGGGTGGHINPAVAIANTIKKNHPQAEIAFVGTKRGKEKELVPKEGYPLYFVDVQGIRRSLSPKNIKALYLALVSPLRAKKLLEQYRPDFVVGTGGYACWPVMKAASKLGIPTAVHESNALAGLAIRKLQDGMDRIFINFPQTEEQIKKQNRHKVMHVGNPLREGFGGLSYENARKKLGLRDGEQMVLSFGGSLGAERINEAMLDLMGEYAPKHPEIRIVHACGTVKYGPIYEEFCRRGLDALPNVMLTPYIYDMPTQMASADVVICRAGAMTISELALMKKACVMIPSPNVTDNHQYKNAKALADGGAAVLLEEKDMLSGRLTQEVSALLTDGVARHSMEEAIASFARTDANKLIYDELMRLMAQSKKQGGEPLPEIPTPDVMPE
jgi:UDP-N-acetylglucosamine--N-acetylmuramyl-(pentapeptide) pyrophosphoryl-undecaprenol N-acetylglucosamine transferase